MSISEVNAGQWVRCADLGWPLDRLGPEAEIWVDPLPNETYKKAMAQASREVRAPTDSSAFYAALEKALPWVYAATVMTKMRGIRMKPDTEVLKDTQANRRDVLTACPLLAERVYRLATRGLAGIEDLSWRAVAVRHRGALQEVKGLLAAGGRDLDNGDLLEAIRVVIESVEIAA